MANLTKKQRRSSIGRFLLDVIKPVPGLSILGKHDRESDHSIHDIKQEQRQTPQPSRVASPSSPPACIALQNEDLAEDAVVITALNVVPFCCHADLVTMTRSQLLHVAHTLNEKLPHAMQIDTSPSRPDFSIRHSIELLVGLRDSVPKATTQPATRARLSLDTTLYNTPRRTAGKRTPPSSPISPLANRSRMSMSFGTPSLAILPEDSQEDEHRSTPPQKKRRADTPEPFFSHTGPITRAQSRRVAPLLAKTSSPSRAARQSPASVRVLRTRSVPLSLPLPLLGTKDSPRRPTRTKSAVATKRQGFVMTSTPKKRPTSTVVSPERGGRRPRSFLADVLNIGGRAKREDLSVTSVDMEELTFDLDGMTMPHISVDDEGHSDCDCD